MEGISSLDAYWILQERWVEDAADKDSNLYTEQIDTNKTLVIDSWKKYIEENYV